MIKTNFKRYDLLYKEFMTILVNKTPLYFTYHNPLHTEGVIEKAELIGVSENLSMEQLELLKIAALFHDFGFLYDIANHEEKGCQIVVEELSTRDFEQYEVEEVCKMIMATKVSQKPDNIMEKILVDADLHYLGTGEFFKISDELFREKKYFNKSIDENHWLKIQIDFLTRHQYYTDHCKVNREPIKQENLRILKRSAE